MDKKFLEGKDKPKQYNLIEKIGQGGFGTAYKAEDTINKKTVAIKIFRNDFDPNNELLEDWKREAEQALQIKGEHVIESIEFRNSETEDGSNLNYLVMEFANNGSLKGLIDTQKQGSEEFLSEHILKDIFLQALNGLGTIHLQSLHRDIKPENLLFVDKVLKISDFGLAKYIDESTRTRTYKGWGTYKYMAPESWNLGKMSKATDIYSLGIVFYELATLQLPYSSADIKELEELHKFGSIPSVRVVNSNLSPKIEGIIKKMMQKSPNDRYQTAEEIIEQLQGPNPTNNIDLGPTLSIAKQILEKQEQERSESMKHEEENQLKLKASRYKIQELIDLINNVVEEISSSIPEERLWLSKGNDEDYTLIWGGKDLIRFHFYPTTFTSKLTVDGQFIIANGYGEIMVSVQENEGVNFILCKNNEDEQYGTWKVLEVRSNPLVPKPSYPLAVLYPVLERISKIGNAMDIFQHTTRDDMKSEIQSLIHKAFEYLNNPPQPQKQNIPHIYDPETMFDEDDIGFGV